jgi:GalNAc-alpha-(1->4)-GalNAc-alpha-(1->3)-diNAcBac-PP-undecaprenol alpha-1,4-N-acetyl-D-galactosaminyltransferase
MKMTQHIKIDEGSPCIFVATLTAGGAERVASIVASIWSETQKVTLITYFDEPCFYPVDPRVNLMCLGLQARRGQIGRALDVIRAMFRMRRLVTRLRPKFVLSFMNKYNAFCLASLRGTAIPVIASERNSPVRELPRIRVFARDMLYPSAAGLICQTEEGLDFMKARTPLRETIVIPNPVSPFIKPGERDAEEIVLAVGRLMPSKGFDQLLRAFAGMESRNWRLIICGEGPMRAKLEQEALSLGVSERVEFPGLVRDLRPYYRRAGIFAFPSLHEGFPNALAEAMVSGLPCVSYDCPTGPSDIIVDGENGLLLPLGDETALSTALDRLATDRGFAEQLGARAAELRERMDPRHIAGTFLAFCDMAARRRESA